jgi:hypothetical protein
MKPILLVSIACLTLAACNTTQPVLLAPTFEVVQPPAELYSQCDKQYTSTKALPNPDTLTDEQIANYIIKLEKAVKICHDNNSAIKTFLEKAKKTVARREAASAR